MTISQMVQELLFDKQIHTATSRHLSERSSSLHPSLHGR